MLDQIIRGVEIAGTVMDAALLLRVLALRLHRLYTFITLFCALNVLLDVSAWAAGWDSAASARIFVYSRFVLLLVYPLAAWDVFEGPKSPITIVRRLHTRRLISGIVMAPLFALALSLGIEDQEVANVGSALTLFFALFVWFSCALTSLLFLLNMYRTAKKERLILAGNTLVWTVFFLISFGRELVDCSVFVAEAWLGKFATDVIQILLACVDLGLSAWCIWKLRGISSSAPAAENAGA